MKTKLSSRLATTEVVHTFPALYKDVNSELVVLATSVERGMVVGDTSRYGLGVHCAAWKDFTDAKEWTRLPDGQILELSNG